MSIWECPKCADKGTVSTHLYGQTECKRCGYKKGSDDHYNRVEEQRAKDQDEIGRKLWPLIPW